jgi:photosystem II stability/assembly factor-like uncharacterized protein
MTQQQRLFLTAACVFVSSFADAFPGQATASAGQVETAVSIRLIDRDADRPAFWEGFFPRSAAMLDDAQLNDLCSVGSNCWAVGERGVVLTSLDQGTTWSVAALPFDCKLQCVTFLTNRIGWIAGTTIDRYSTDSQAVLLATRDGGMTWTDTLADSTAAAAVPGPIIGPQISAIYQVQFFGLQDGLAVATVGQHQRATLLRTSDGGRSWTIVQSDADQSEWASAAFLSLQEGIVAGHRLSFGAYVAEKVITLNHPDGTNRCVSDISLTADGQGWMCGDGGLLLATVDSGISWTVANTAISTSLQFALDLNTIAHHGTTVLTAGSPGSAVLRSTDSGRTWDFVALPGTVPVSRIRFVADHSALAVGSCGSVYRTDDDGASWKSVRGAKRRCGMLQFVTNHSDAAAAVLASTAGNDGIRSAVIQLSTDSRVESRSIASQRDRVQQVVNGLGGNHFEQDWRFRRTAPEQHLTIDALTAEWNRATDGRFKEAFPERLACLIRTWRPTTIVLDPTGSQDAVTQLIKAALPTALQLAAQQGAEDSDLERLRLPPHQVSRILMKSDQERSTPLAFRKDDLLVNAGTTIELATHFARTVLVTGKNASSEVPEVTHYESIGDGHTTVTPTGVMQGLNSQVGTDARRPVEHFSPGSVEDLQQVILAARTESAALKGHTLLAETENSLMAHVTGIGAALPPSMALQQLRYLSDLHRQHQNFDGQMAVLQEITRRFPNTADARTAAEQLFLYYSSSEIRHLRIRMMQRREHSSSDSGVRHAAAAERRLLYPERQAPITVTPKIEPASGVRFGNGSQHLPALLQTWDKKAADSLSLISRTATADNVSPRVILRHAANLRAAGRSGDQATILGQLSASPHQASQYAQAEMQAEFAANAPAIPTINVALAANPPFLDGQLTDACWERATEIRLSSLGDVSTREHADSLVFMSFDSEFLYIFGRVEHAAAGSADVPLAIDRQYDADHGTNDRIEISLDTDRDYSTSFTMRIDQTGLTSESCWEMTSWNPRWYVSSESDAAAWRFEIAIPMEELAQRAARPGDLWVFTVRRICPGVIQQTFTVQKTDQTREDGVFLVRFIRTRR